MGMAWLTLGAAGLFEIAWAVGLKYTVGFTRLWPSVFTVSAMVASFWLLSVALKVLPIGTAYAVWTGIGATGTAIIGMAFLGDAVSLPRLLGIGMIVGGILVLKAAG
ncbi:quaternary ammonium compound-resistance protein SugE [Roseococcus suduntuyensis]|uniref:Guanidinium exporter n=2 Tax=Roseococcus suduntuyensis TaxID=455361 RepID=A0A840ABA6_9PROT|nr:quaternary ammonium compound-resistance protein SugE [Roseococcus suduntuyensis]